MKRLRTVTKFFVVAILVIVSLFIWSGYFRKVFRWQHSHRTSDFLGNVQVSTQKNEIMLFGYQRGGTTFLGHLLGQRKDTFYHYEPLLTFGEFEYFSNDGRCLLRKAECRFESTKGAINYLESVYICNHANMQMGTISQQTWGTFRELYKELFKMYSKTPNESFYLKELADKCFDSTNILMKVLRISMKLASQFLSSRSNLKIVHLIRDPRAIILSRIEAFKAKDIPGWSKSLCQKMAEDYKEAKRILRLFPKRIFILIYEDFVNRPDALLGPLHKFAGLSFSKEDEIRIMKLMMPSSNTEQRERYSVVRPLGSVHTSMNWRKIIPFSVMKIIDRECSRSLQLLNYTRFSSKETLRDLNKPAFSGKSLY